MKVKLHFLLKFILSWIIDKLKFINMIVPKKRQILIYNSTEVYMNNYALYDYLIKNGYNNDYKIYYAMPNVCNFTKKKSNVVYIDLSHKHSKIRTVMVFFYSEFVFYDNSNIRIPSKKNQTIINLWHGTPLKKIGFMAQSATVLTKNSLNCFDKIILSNDYQDDIYMKSFNLNKDQLLHIGAPRNDLMFKQELVLSKIIEDCNSFNKRVIWMTTYRVTNDGILHTKNINWSDTGIPLLVNDEKLHDINEYLKNKGILLIIKMHNNNKQNNIRNIKFSNIRYIDEKMYISKGIQLYELLSETDALITDYSSIYFDYLLINKPIGFILDDYESYKATNGLYYDDKNFYLPGDHIYNFNELIQFFEKICINLDDKINNRRIINDLFNKYDQKGNNIARLLDILHIKKG